MDGEGVAKVRPSSQQKRLAQYKHKVVVCNRRRISQPKMQPVAVTELASQMRSWSSRVPWSFQGAVGLTSRQHDNPELDRQRTVRAQHELVNMASGIVLQLVPPSGPEQTIHIGHLTTKLILPHASSIEGKHRRLFEVRQRPFLDRDSTDIRFPKPKFDFFLFCSCFDTIRLLLLARWTGPFWHSMQEGFWATVGRLEWIKDFRTDPPKDARSRSR